MTPFEARKLWNPSLARVYGIYPWQMQDLLPSEINAIAEDVEELNRGA